MQIGIVGAGNVAQAFASKAINAGHSVVFSNSRGPQSLAPIVTRFGPMATAAPVTVAIENPIVLLALPWPKVDGALRNISTWHGQILIDPSNAFRGGTPAHGIVNFKDSSSSEHVAALAPGARVVKAMNSNFMSNFEREPTDGRFRRAVFISGDDRAARNTVADLLESFGFAPVDLGSLRVGGRIQAVGGPIAGHDFFLPWPAPRSMPAFNGETAQK